MISHAHKFDAFEITGIEVFKRSHTIFLRKKHPAHAQLYQKHRRVVDRINLPRRVKTTTNIALENAGFELWRPCNSLMSDGRSLFIPEAAEAKDETDDKSHLVF